MLAILFLPELPATLTSPAMEAIAPALQSTEAIAPIRPFPSSPESSTVEFSHSQDHSIAAPPILLAQNVQAADDGMGTDVNQVGDRFDIQGGQRAGDNLFHSFEAFGLDANEIANFISENGIENILGRVTGGNPSIIDGLIQMTGGNSNLYLMNPAGFLFGNNASLNLPAAFTATTANGIGIGSGWFNATGDNDFARLVGAPRQFAFTGSEAGAIANLGNLSVANGESLSLIGGTVVNMGTLSAPGGQVTIAAVPGENTVSIRQDGMVLGLEFEPLPPNNGAPLPSITPLSLPALLTGGGVDHASGITVNPDGTVRLGAATVEPVMGTAIASGTLTVADTSPGAMGGQMAVVGDRVALLDATLEASGTHGGGTIWVGGGFQGQGTIPNATQTYVDDASTLNANAIQRGRGGEVIVWAGDRTEFYGTINARGGATSGDGGLAEVSGHQSLVFNGSVDLSATQGQMGTLLLDPENIIIVNGNGGADDEQLNGNIPDFGDPPGRIFSDDPGTTFTLSETTLENVIGSIILQATNDVIVNDLADNVLNLQVETGQQFQVIADADGNGFGAFQMNAGDTLRTQGGDVVISGASIQAGHFDTFVSSAPVGVVHLTSTGALTTGDITTSSDIRLTSEGDMQLGALVLRPDATFASDGDVVLISNAGNIEVFTIDNRDPGGTIRISAAGLFRATGSFEASFLPFFSEIPGVQNLPVSIRSSLGNSEPVRIRYNGATDADPALSTVTDPVFPVDSFTLSIGGNGAPFSVGPEVIGVIDPNEGDLVNGYRNEQYAPRPLPENGSGMVGAIAVTTGNGSLFGSVQDIPFQAVDDGDIGDGDIGDGDIGDGNIGDGDIGGGDIGGGNGGGDVIGGDIGGGNGGDLGGGDIVNGDVVALETSDLSNEPAELATSILRSANEAQVETPNRSEQCSPLNDIEDGKRFGSLADPSGTTGFNPCRSDSAEPILQIDPLLSEPPHSR